MVYSELNIVNKGRKYRKFPLECGEIMTLLLSVIYGQHPQRPQRNTGAEAASSAQGEDSDERALILESQGGPVPSDGPGDVALISAW